MNHPEGDSASANAGDGLSLPIGTRIAEFEILERIGEGGFSIVYLAMDHSLERKVALKEYMPSSLAARVSPTQVQPRSSRHQDTFEAGLRSFVNEARLLAQFDHPALIKVYRFWESNGTAYMVMPFYQGVTLKVAVRALPAPPGQAWLMALLDPLTEALMVIHAEHCFHRDIAPDNVLLLAGSGKPLLLDFGAARRVIGDMTQALTVILKPGYAPIEQYAEVPGMKQGPWTDVYALAAVIYWAVTGKTPPASVGRVVNDSFIPLAQCAAGQYNLPFLQAIDRALLVLPERRTPSIERLRLDLGLSAPSDCSGQLRSRGHDPDATVLQTPPSRPPLPEGGPSIDEVPAAAEQPLTALAPPVIASQRWPPGAGRQAVETPALQEPAKADRVGTAQSGRIPRLLATAAVVAALAAAGVWLALPTTEPEHAPGTEDASAARTLPMPPAPIGTPAAQASPAVEPAKMPEAETINSTATAGSPTGAKRSAASREAAPVKPLPMAPRTERRPVEPAASDECARIAHQQSLGDSSPELMARLQTLKCR